MERITLSKKIRFDVFKRDGFTCQYCGNTPPSVTLEVDHIHPVASGGTNDKDNLITACFDCNRGKGATHLSAIPETVAHRAAVLAEREDQSKAYNRLLAGKRKREKQELDALQDIFCGTYQLKDFAAQYRQSIKGNFINKLDGETLRMAMAKACADERRSPADAFRYFCGVCWNIIKGRSNGPR